MLESKYMGLHTQLQSVAACNIIGLMGMIQFYVGCLVFM
jgi:hypothetical protein